jgi:hypothetical protein
VFSHAVLAGVCRRARKREDHRPCAAVGQYTASLNRAWPESTDSERHYPKSGGLSIARS